MNNHSVGGRVGFWLLALLPLVLVAIWLYRSLPILQEDPAMTEVPDETELQPLLGVVHPRRF